MLAERPGLMANVIICSAAEVDYTESLTWYAANSIDAANDFDAEFGRSLELIAADPERYPLCDARHRYFLLRRFPFRIIYRMIGGDVFVIAVAHSSRSPDYWSDR